MPAPVACSLTRGRSHHGLVHLWRGVPLLEPSGHPGAVLHGECRFEVADDAIPLGRVCAAIDQDLPARFEGAQLRCGGLVTDDQVLVTAGVYVTGHGRSQRRQSRDPARGPVLGLAAEAHRSKYDGRRAEGEAGDAAPPQDYLVLPRTEVVELVDLVVDPIPNVVLFREWAGG